ncbi:S41 family peptidase [Flavobacterium sp.]|uniref:S41 family peptidase n=1 Tax=Flavobacterium sp. TaxID=239 RepID=UPI003B9B01B0
MGRNFWVVALCVLVNFAWSQQLVYCERFEAMVNFLKVNHLQPKPIDENLSKYLFDGLLNNLDPNRSLLSKTDYEELAGYRTQLHTSLLKKDCYFTELVWNIYVSALNRKLLYFKNIDASLLRTEGSETLRFSTEPFEFDVTVEDLPKLWNKRIKYIALDEVARLSKNKDSLTPFVEELAAAKRSEIVAREVCRIENILNKQGELNEEIAETLLNLIGSYFDPHTNYFNASEAKSFMSGLATANKSFGLMLELDEKEQLIVVGILPGSSAAKVPGIQPGDIIRKVRLPKTGFEYDTACSNMEQLAIIIYGEEEEEVTFEIEKQDQRREKVTLTKNLVPSVENTLTVFVSETSPKVAYIKVSSFYSDFDGSNRGLTADFLEALLKCENEKIKGLIIDLSGNGGGSVDEAHRLSSLFIEGPVAYSSDKNSQINYYQDLIPFYKPDYPIAIITDGTSASASEFFASAMQDYGKAIVCGTASCGKATMQFITPIDKRSNSDLCKVTARSFFRPTGETIQKKGIVPDIELPALYNNVISREANFETALSIPKIQVPKPDGLRKFRKLKSLRKKSLARIAASPYFNEVQRVNPLIEKLANGENKEIPLKFQAIYEQVHSIDQLYAEVVALDKLETDVKFKNLSIDNQKIESDPFSIELNKMALDEVSRNFRLAEVYRILKDYIGK